MSDKKLQTISLYRPNRTPWIAERNGTERWVWYLVKDCEGTVLFQTGPVALCDEDQLCANLFLAMTSVNGNSTVKVNNEPISVEWK